MAAVRDMPGYSEISSTALGAAPALAAEAERAQAAQLDERVAEIREESQAQCSALERTVVADCDKLIKHKSREACVHKWMDFR